MTKADLIEKVHRATNFHFKDCTKVVDCFLCEISRSLINKEGVEIRNFGVFKVVKSAPRKGRADLREGGQEEIHIPARYRVKFTIGKNVLERIRGRRKN